jgi:acyl-coenzyme A thioesterase PaaI-like protein
MWKALKVSLKIKTLHKCFYFGILYHMLQNLFQLPKLAKYAAASKKWLDLLEFDIRNISVDNNQIACTISFPEKLTGNDGIIHGGITCFVIDSVAGIHAQMFFDKNGTALTKNLSVDFLQPILPQKIYQITTHASEQGIIVEISQNDQVYAKGLVIMTIKRIDRC